MNSYSPDKLCFVEAPNLEGLYKVYTVYMRRVLTCQCSDRIRLSAPSYFISECLTTVWDRLDSSMT